MAADWAAATERVSLVGQRVDRYQVVARLGSGSMGDVYRATDTILGRDVALKVLTPALHADSGFRRRLEQEARAASSLNHPNIVTVYEIGQSGTIDFVALELVDGVTLRVRLTAGRCPSASSSTSAARSRGRVGCAQRRHRSPCRLLPRMTGQCNETTR
jgi:serine/threonine protein kinase